MMLRDLDAYFIRYETKVEEYEVVDGDTETWHERGCPTRKITGPRQYIHVAGTLAEAQGVMFLCPLCYTANGGPVGTHIVDVSFADRGLTPAQGTHGRNGEPTRWTVTGTSLDNLTLSPSVMLDGTGCGWHGFVQQGNAA